MRSTVIAILMLAIFVVFALPLTVEAYPRSTELGHFELTELSYTLKADRKVTVEMNFTLLNTSSNQVISGTSWKVPSPTVSEVEVGGSVKYDGKEVESNTTTIKIKFLGGLGPGERITYSVSFVASGLIEGSYPEFKGRFGQRGDPSYIGFGRLRHEKYAVTVQGPQGTDFFLANPPPSKVLENDPPRIEYTTYLSADEEFAGIQTYFYSRPVYYKLTLTESITNPHDEAFEDAWLDVVLFGEMGSQFAALTNPTPMAMYVDRENNWHAVYNIGTIPAGYSGKLDINVLFKCDIYESGASKNNTGNLSDVPIELIPYLQPDRYWEVDNQSIRENAHEIVKDENNAYLVAKAIVENVSKEIKYPEESRLALYENRQGALRTLLNREGDCDCFSDLTIALSRAENLPARMSMGWAYEDAKPVGHAWVEFYLPNLGWQPADPTWAKTSGDYLGRLDPIHLLRNTWGLSSTGLNVSLTCYGATPEVGDISESTSLTVLREPEAIAEKLISSAELTIEIAERQGQELADAKSLLDQAQHASNIDEQISLAEKALEVAYSTFPRPGSPPERPFHIPPWLIWVCIAAIVAGVAAIVGGKLYSRATRSKASFPLKT